MQAWSLPTSTQNLFGDVLHNANKCAANTASQQKLLMTRDDTACNSTLPQQCKRPTTLDDTSQCPRQPF